MKWGQDLGEEVHGAQTPAMNMFLGNLNHFVKSKTAQITDIKKKKAPITEILNCDTSRYRLSITEKLLSISQDKSHWNQKRVPEAECGLK